MREVRTLRRWVRLGVYAAIFGSEPIYIFLLHFNLTQVLVGLAIGLTIAFCAIEGAFSQMFKLRKRSAYPAVLLEQLGAASTVGEAAGHGLEAINRLTGASCCAALLDAGDELRLLPSPHMTPDEAEGLLEAGGAAVTAAIAGQRPVVFGAAPPQADGRRLVFVPIIALRQTIGVLALSGGPGHRDLKDEQLLQSMGKALGLSLENLRQKEDLRQSEERFRRVVTGAPVVLFAVDSDGIITLIEGKGLETLGIAPEQVVGRPMTDVYASYPEIIEGIERSYAGEEVTFTAEIGGALFEARLCPVFGIDGRVSGVIGVATDITERKRAEEALRESEEKYRELVENTNEVIYTLDATGIITYVSPVVEQVGGYAPSDVVGRSFSELIHPDDLMPLIESFQRTLSGQLEPSEYRLKTKDGEYRWVRSSSRPIYDGDRAIGLRGLLVDLTERRNAEEALRAIVEGTAGETGSEFFHSLARHLASAVGAKYAFVAELTRGAPDRISTLAMWMGGDFGETAQYDLPGTPCEGVVAGEMRHYPRDVRALFPDNRLLADMEIESYLGAPLFDSLGNTQGLLAVLDDKPMDDTPSVRSIMTIFAARAGAELERKQAEEALRESEAKNRALLGAIPDTVIRLRADGTYLDFKAGRDAAFNLPPEGLVGKRLQEVLPPDIMEPAMHHIQRALETGEPQMYEHRFQDGQSESYFEARIVASGHDEVVAIVRDITQRKQAEETIRRLAYHDALTGLPNRALFEDRLSVALAQARRHNQTLAVMFLDLDHFKTVNDTLGHSGGDKLLQSVAKELTLLVRDGDTVARVGGDEFTLLLPNITRIDDATNVAERVLEMLRQPRLLGGHEFQVGTSIGITVFPADGQDPERLLRNADTAMYRAKERGRDNYQLYTPAMNARIIERLALENDLRHALERQELFLLYQPLVEVASGRIVGAEALLRWQHPERGTVLPDEFIPFAEETGLILPIGDWVLETACQQNKRWQQDGHPPIRVTVNLSARQLQQEHLVATVARVLSEAALEPRYLQLEITEGAVMTNVEHIIAMLHELRVMGVGIAVDDFGTGYSSLSYLKRFPIDSVKIDRSFVRDLATDPNDAAIVTTVIAMSRSLNLKVIAEGVETERQLEFLRDRGCDEFQGYLFGRPMPPDRIGGLLGGRRRVARARSA